MENKTPLMKLEEWVTDRMIHYVMPISELEIKEKIRSLYPEEREMVDFAYLDGFGEPFRNDNYFKEEYASHPTNK